jgi:hypothetical protein
MPREECRQGQFASSVKHPRCLVTVRAQDDRRDPMFQGLRPCSRYDRLLLSTDDVFFSLGL